MNWPSQSPDLNTIQVLWEDLKVAVPEGNSQTSYNYRISA